MDGQVTEKIRAHASYTLTDTEDKATGERLNNSPEHLGKLNLTAPVVGDWLFAGAEAQYRSEVTTVAGQTLDGLWLFNATPFSARLRDAWEFSATVYNVFDTEYHEPTLGDIDTVEADGRSFRVKAVHRF